MKWAVPAVGLLLGAGGVVFGYPLFCMLKRFWGWRRLRRS